MQLCNCTRSIASTISPIDLRAAYLLHYYYPRLIFFHECGSSRIVYDQGDEEKECRVGGIHRSFRSILLYLFKLFTVIRNVTGKETKISNLSRIFENLLIELSGRAKRQVTCSTVNEIAGIITIGYGSKEIPGRFLALLLLSSRHVVPPISPTFLRLLRDLLCTINLTLAGSFTTHLLSHLFFNGGPTSRPDQPSINRY